MKTSPKFRYAVSCGSLFLVCGCQTTARMTAEKVPTPPPAATSPSAQETKAAASSQPAADVAFEDTPASRFDEVLLTNFEDGVEAGIEGTEKLEEVPPSPAAPGNELRPIPENGNRLASVQVGLTLEMLEQIALENNPSITQAGASASKASGFRKQVGMYPNPNIGYSGQQLDDAGTAQHLGYVEQEVVTAHKLKLNQRVLDQEVQSQLWEVEAQRYRVLTDVRQRFYDALAAQQRRDLAIDFEKVAQEGVRVAELRRQALEGSVPEVLQTEIQLNEVQLIRQRSEIAYHAAWQQLIAVAGIPHMAPSPLVGELRVSSEKRDWDSTYLQLVGGSPAIQAARARVSRAVANMDRQDVQAIPNLQTLTSAGYDYGTNHSMIQVQMGIALPIFNQNIGNISAAQAEYCRAAQEVRRLELSLQSQLAVAAQQYDSAAVTVERYEKNILPMARQTLELSEKAYGAGEFGFLQVLVARRTFFDSNLQYNEALQNLADAKCLLDGMLLDGGLNETADTSMDDGLRGQTLSGQ
ncbi:TolC family protein [Planctomicrobium sp. SH661]|uniref:TolC family protein n=1 Tax=Planctomicrobium sp. SH661 TaxID=3448124 RepID=UPI003F5C6DFF